MNDVSDDWLEKFLSYQPPEIGEPYCGGEPPKKSLLCWLGLHRSICSNIVCGQRFDTCNECMRRTS